MGYNDLPIIDKPRGNSEKSVQKLRSLLNIQSGFTLREDVPDYGCDFDAELIVNGNQASNQRFPIQIKSVERLQVIEEGKYISYPFETSRLGYLRRRIPSGGIIIIYSVERDECFFEYCDRIYGRVMEEKQSQTWFANEKVNIHIPVSNVLTPVSAKTLHQTFSNRFSQAALMQNSIGWKYGLPSVLSDKKIKYDLNNPDDVKLFLQEHGILLLNSYDLHITYSMISRLSLTDIYSNKDLLMVAAVSYAEMGMHAESRVFSARLSSHELDDDTKMALRFLELKNDLALGYTDTDKYIEGLEDLLSDRQIDQNKIILEINLAHFRLAKKLSLEPMPPGILEQINNVFIEVEHLPASRRAKDFLLLWNCENLSFFISTVESDALSDFAIRESLKDKVMPAERQAAADELILLQNKLYEILHRVNKSAVAASHKILNAHVLNLDVRHYLCAQINYVSFEMQVNKLPDFEKRLSSKIEIAAKAYNIFREADMSNYAYDCLCVMLELIELAEAGHNIATNRNKEELSDSKEKMEKLPEVMARPLILPSLIKRKKLEQQYPVKPNTSFIQDFNDIQLETFARTTLQSKKLPEDNLPYILHEMKAHRLFYQRCTDPDIDFVQEQSPLSVYSNNARFILRNLRSGIISPPGSDMDSLLKAWGL